MADSEGIKEVICQAAVQAAAVIMVTFRDTETGLCPATTLNQ